MKSNLVLLYIFISLTTISQSMYIDVDNEPFCLTLDAVNGSSYRISY